MKRDAEPDFDWTFSAIPPDDAPPPVPAAPVQPPRAPRRPPPRWLGPALLMLVLLLGGTAFIYSRRGWRALEAQVAREVRYEDEQARAGAVGLVLAMQFTGDEAWRRLREAEVALRWPAPQPAPHLLPLAEVPQVGPLRALGSSLFEVTVTRRYADAAGQAGAFDLTQRYRNVGPGLWERLPPDTAALALVDTWTAPRLRATYPHAEAGWLPPLLLQVEALLEQACRDWDCPAEAVVALEFSSQLQDLTPQGLPARALGRAGDPYPLVFDLPAGQPRYPPRIVWPTPRLTGVPRDEPARALLVRALAVAGLANLAEQLSGQARQPNDFFFDALVARAEVRLGLLVPPNFLVSAEDYVPIEGLWRRPAAAGRLDRAAALPFQQQALAFLDAVLAGHPLAADGQLLRSLNQANSLNGLVGWLEPVVGVGAPALAAQRSTRFPFMPQEVSPFAWSQLEGMGLICDGGLALLRGGQRVPLPLTLGSPAFVGGYALSPNGRYAAAVDFSPVTGVVYETPRLTVYDLRTQELQVVTEGSPMSLLGWSADEILFYWEHPSTTTIVTRAGEALPGETGSVLMRYNPAAGRPSRLWALSAVQTAAWSHDHAGLYVTTREPQEAAPIEIGWLPLAGRLPNRLPVEPLITGGRSPLLSPDGQTLAYVSLAEPASDDADQPRAIVLFDLAHGTQTPLVTLDDVLLKSAFGDFEPFDLSVSAWSPDGQRLAFLAAHQFATRLFTIRRDGSGLREEVALEGSYPPFVSVVGFSADDRFLAYVALEENPITFPELTVVDLETGSTTQVKYNGASWSPTGHLLALADDAGVYLLDPATGRQRWVTFGNCTGVDW